MFRSHALRLSTFALLAVAAGAHAEIIYGITDDATSRLVTIDTATPNNVVLGASISGLVAGQSLRSIDFRPSNGKLYAVSSNVTTDVAQLYTVNLTTGALTTVGSTFSLVTGSTRVSIDFNPVVDRLRVVTGDNRNLRINPDTGMIAATDTNYAFDPSDPNFDPADSAYLGDVAYTNNVAGATQTTLYGYEFNTDSLVTVGTANGVQSPNTGVLHTVGSSNQNASSTAMGFDFSGVTGIGYVTFDEFFSNDFYSELFTVNTATGALTQIGTEVGANTGGDFELLDISVAPKPVPEPASMIALGMGAAALIRRRRKG